MGDATVDRATGTLGAIGGIDLPGDRLLGALAIALGGAYWRAHKDPLRNVAILKVGAVDSGLATFTVIVLGLTVGVSNWFAWVSAVAPALFCLALLALMPEAADPGRAA